MPNDKEMFNQLPNGSSNRASAGSARSPWEPVVPVPDGAPSRLVTHNRFGKPSFVWTYRDQENRLYGYVCRFDGPTGNKKILPLSYCRHRERGVFAWRWQALSKPRPLYNLHELELRPDAPVILVEGEKAADAASQLLPSYVAVTSPGGSKAAKQANWSVLAGRAVSIWPDADEAGSGYAADAVRCLMDAGAIVQGIVSPPQGIAKGWDAADAEAEGWDTTGALRLVNAAQAVVGPLPNGSASVFSAGDDDGSNGSRSEGHRKTPPLRDVLIGLAEECELWHAPNKDTFATLPSDRHCANVSLRSTEFRRWLGHRVFSEHSRVAGGQALDDAIRHLEAKAEIDGARYDPMRRVGYADGAAYLDLADDELRVVEITRSGWRLVDNPPVKFVRSRNMQPLPAPEAGGLIEKLRNFVNVRTDSDFKMIVAWLVAALRSQGPFPILVLHGEQGTAKSTTTRVLRSLIDPSKPLIRSVPREERDLVIGASNAWVLAFDNMSGIPPWLSDALCRMSTGGGYSTRALHTDSDEFVFDGQRPIILNGIPDMTARPDLGSRAVPIELPVLTEQERRSESEFFEEFERARPSILGALFDAVSAALRYLPETQLDRLPRMADFAKWVTAAEPSLGWEPGTFLKVYEENRNDIVAESIDANPVAKAIKDFVLQDHPHGWLGSPTELLEELNSFISENIRTSRSWPRAVNTFGGALKRVAPLLRQIGFTIEQVHSGNRSVRISPPRDNG